MSTKNASYQTTGSDPEDFSRSACVENTSRRSRERKENPSPKDGLNFETLAKESPPKLTPKQQQPPRFDKYAVLGVTISPLLYPNCSHLWFEVEGGDRQSTADLLTSGQTLETQEEVA